jgi:choline dehydrogenase-like flavoprotein
VTVTNSLPKHLDLRKAFDVAIIGAGLGGGTLGHALASRGHSVLFIERGHWQSPGAVLDDTDVSAHAQLERGWWPAEFTHHDGQSTATFQHPVGCGTGGSSGIFGMMMERFRREDFEPGHLVRSRGDSTVPDTWPITYDELAPYYARAERLYRVRGTADPLFPEPADYLPPPAATNKEQTLLDALSACGLHPYRFHYSCERVTGCNSCPGTICPRECRNDSHRICVRPATEQFGAAVLSNCRVERLESANRRVTEILAEHQGVECRLRARIVVLAANAFASPTILLKSRGEHGATALGNSSGIVGRNLMLHVSDSLLVKRRGLSSRLKPLGAAMNHGLALNDFYTIDGVKHGNVHAHPISLSPESVFKYLQLKYPRRVRQWPRTARSAAWIGATVHAEKTYFATVLDDLPYADNGIRAADSSGDHIAYSYTVRDELRQRAGRLVDAFSRAIRSRCSVQVFGHTGQLNRGHACGTIRFGNDPRTSVLDATNRAHEVENLYVVDASFFPTSGGINPGLTIAANALRVADIISARL